MTRQTSSVKRQASNVECQQLEDWAAAVTRRGLAAPALLLLEAAQPLRYLLQQVCWLAHPLLGQRAMLWAMLLEDEQSLAELQEHIRRADAMPQPGHHKS